MIKFENTDTLNKKEVKIGITAVLGVCDLEVVSKPQASQDS